jgi:DNA-binding MarR family transcriptional regulator
MMHVALQIFQTAQGLEQAARRTFSPHGLTLAQFNVLDLLSLQPNGLRAKDLAGALIVDPSNITGLLKRMARDGLVRNLANTADRRQRIVALTPAGRRKWRRALAAYEANLRELYAVLQPGEPELVGGVLDRLRGKAAALPV